MNETPGYLLSREAAGQIAEVVRERAHQRKPVVGRSGPPHRGSTYAPRSFMARIVSADSLGGNRWRYTVEEVEKTADGLSGFTAKAEADGARSGTAYNLAEIGNTATQIQGQDLTALPAAASNVAAVAVAVDSVVRVDMVYTPDGEDRFEYWFDRPNWITWECST